MTSSVFDFSNFSRVFIAAEAGLNHNGDLKLAHQLIDLAAAAGADGIKFQNYRTEDFLSDHTLTHCYVSRGQEVEESQFAMFKRCELSREWIQELADHCREKAICFFSTPTNLEGLADLVKAGAPLIKNGSDYLQNLPLIRGMAQTGLPTVLSTGMATLAEMDDAVRAFRESGGKKLLLLHCTSAYPTLPKDAHLRKIPALQAAFGCPVGLSDHSHGIVNAVASVALGACFVEKHFTYDKNALGPDHAFSCDPAELSELVKSIRIVEQSLGSSRLGPADGESHSRETFRLSCVTKTALPAGHILSEQDLAFRRPGGGLPPKFSGLLVGRSLRLHLPSGSVITLDHLQ